VFYHLDSFGGISDSSYQYFPIVNPDVSHFDGPELSICFEVKLIIHRKKYNYEDFSMWYQFYDIENTTDLPNKVDKSIIYESDMLESKDGFYHICHDLELKYHLMPVFGIFADDNVSEQDLTFGEMKDPIINKNIDSTDL
jgi:hypothetical protein